jgi:hypothetical protein
MKNQTLLLAYFASIFYFLLNLCIQASTDNTLNTESVCSIKKANVNLRPELQHAINLFWINKELDLNQNYIFPSQDETELTNTHLKTILDWATKNPYNTIIQVWYDGSLITQDAVDNTQKLINKSISDSSLVAPIIFRDVRSLPFVEQNPHIFESKLDVYFRADLLRLIVSLHDILVEDISYSMYADLDMPPITYEEIYDEETLETLENFGIILTKDLSAGIHGFENNFHIISHHNNNILEAIQFVVIDVNVERAKNLLRKSVSLDQNPLFRQMVFTSYRDMFQYFYYLEGYYEKIEVTEEDEDEGGQKPTGELYSKEIHGLAPFTYRDYDVDPRLKYYKGKGRFLPYAKKGMIFFYPVKIINMPRAKSQYTNLGRSDQKH